MTSRKRRGIPNGLHLERCVGQEVWIEGGRLKITVLEAHKSRVRLVFHGDRTIAVDRGERINPEHEDSPHGEV